MRSTGRWVRIVCLLFLLVPTGILAANQSIEGVIRDETDGVVPGVRVQLTHVGTNVSREMITDQGGRYVFPAIRTGSYELRATMDGFEPVLIKDIVVRAGDALNYNLRLVVGPLTVEFEILAAVEQVEVTTSQLDTIIDERRITDLPLNGRNPMDLVFLAPGVSRGMYGMPAVNGARGRGNNIMLDGLDNNETIITTEVVQVNADAAAEFSVITSNPSAEYGRGTSAVINVITRSGTNQWHGNVFWFHRNDNLDAAKWEENANPLMKNEFKQNQLGVSLGGPIIHDKLFFFFNVQFDRLRESSVIRLKVPTPEFRNTITNPDMLAFFNAYYPLPNTATELYSGVTGEYVWAAPD